MWLEVLEKPLERREGFVGALLVRAARSSWWCWDGRWRCEVLLVTAPHHSWVQKTGFSERMCLSWPAPVPQFSQVNESPFQALSPRRMSRMRTFTSVLVGLSVWASPNEPCWDSLMEQLYCSLLEGRMSEGHNLCCVGASRGLSSGCVTPNPSDFTARRCSNTRGVANSVFCWVWKGNQVFPSSKNTSWKAW